MKRSLPARGSALLPATLTVLLFILTIVTVYFFIARTWWFPPAITKLGERVDAQFMATLIITGIVFVLAQLALGILLLRFRANGGRAHYTHGNNKLETLWTVATAVMFIGLGIAATRSWATYHSPPSPNALQIEVTGQQFAWNFRYPGPDGTFGRTDPKLIDEAAGNPLGLDMSDPAAKDDLVLPIMAVPVNRQVELIIKSKDVTHSFFVRELRLKQDAVPGMVIPMHFTADKVGTYEVVCAELCGLGHHRMRTTLQVLPEAQYEQWLREQAAY